MSSYCHLTIQERQLIFLYHGLRFTIRRIARLLKRHHTTISRELWRGIDSDQYFPVTADQLYHQRKHACGRWQRLTKYPKLLSVIRSLLKELQWSPKQISYRLKLESAPLQISTTTIYWAIYRGNFDPQELAPGAQGVRRTLHHRGKS